MTVHATLVSSEPAANSRLVTAPRRVRLVFSEPVEGQVSRKVTIVPGSGAPIVAPSQRRPARRSRRDRAGGFAATRQLPGGLASGFGGRAPGGRIVRVRHWRHDVRHPGRRLNHRLHLPQPRPSQEPDVWGPALFGAPVIPAILRGAALGALMAAAGMLLFYVGAGPNAAQFGDRTHPVGHHQVDRRGPILLGAHLVSWLINTSPEHTLDASWAASALSTTVGQVELARLSAGSARVMGVVARATRVRCAQLRGPCASS